MRLWACASFASFWRRAFNACNAWFALPFCSRDMASGSAAEAMTEEESAKATVNKETNSRSLHLPVTSGKWRDDESLRSCLAELWVLEAPQFSLADRDERDFA